MTDPGGLRSGAERDTLSRLLLELMPDWQAHALGDFEYLSGGYSNENYRVEHAGEPFVLRVPSRARPFVDRAHEQAFYHADHPVVIPELMAFDAVTGAMLTRFEPGRLLTDAGIDLLAIAGYLQALHDALPPSGRTYDPVALSRRFLSVGGAPPWIERLAETLDWVPETLAPCHNDLNPWNVIVPESGPWVTLDWEWFGDNDPLFDLVTLHQGLALEDASLRDIATSWLGSEPQAGRLERCLLAFWLREYAWAQAERHHGNRRPEIEQQIEISEGRLQDLI